MDAWMLSPNVLRFRERLLASIRDLPGRVLVEHYHFKNAVQIALLAQDDTLLERWVRLQLHELERVGPEHCGTHAQLERALRIGNDAIAEHKLITDTVAAAVGRTHTGREPPDADLVQVAIDSVKFSMPREQRELVEALDDDPAAGSAVDHCRAKIWSFKAILSATQPQRAQVIYNMLRAEATNPDQFELDDEVRATETLRKSKAEAAAERPHERPADRPYPRIAAMLGIEATILVGVRIGANGALDEAFVKKRKIVVPGPKDMQPLIFERLFDAESLKVAQLRQFKPRYALGKALPYEAQFEVEWKLRD